MENSSSQQISSESESFDGKQAEERLLYVIRPHKLLLLLGALQVLIITIAAYFAWDRLSYEVLRFDESKIELGKGLILSLGMVGLWWKNKYYKCFRAYITDRRIVRFEAIFPVTEKKRTLMWKEVAKTRGAASSFLWRLVKIGELEIVPKVIEGDGEMNVPYTFYFEDLASYIDKIV
ncbi:MAG: hypothetical protein R3A13_12880, partial [Bdellovibrionota bacterium]